MHRFFQKSVRIVRDAFYVKTLGRFPRLQKPLRAIYGWLRGRFCNTPRFSDCENYLAWLEKTRLSKANIQSIKNQVTAFKRTPLISIIMPVYNVNPKWLHAAIDSVLDQIYSKWELCLVNDGSTRPDTIRYLENLSHPQVKKKVLTENCGISVASNAAIQMSTGDYIAFLDHDDVITIDALFEVVRVINVHDPDWIYSDEDRIDENGHRKKPFFKPDWSIDLLRTQNYICHLTVIKKEVIDRIGGFREGFEGAQDYDLFLRVAAGSENVHHIPKILYSWREISTSTAINPDAKPMAQLSGLKAVNSHLDACVKGDTRANESEHLFVYDARYPMNGNPLISIIIPTKDQSGYLKNCLKSIVTKSRYQNYEMIVLDNGSEEPETAAFLRQATSDYPMLKVVEAPYPFNWSKLNNHGMREARGDIFIFLNNDTEVISKDWLERLAEHALREEIAAVGPLLLYQDGTIQHAGVVVGMGGWADHVFKGMAPQHFMANFVSPLVTRNVLAVTGSCLAISRKTVDKIGPFNENFIVCGSDVEICLRAHENGLKNVFDPFVQLYHFESKTRIPENIPHCDFEMSRKHYQRYWNAGDPYFNLNLSLAATTPTPRYQA